MVFDASLLAGQVAESSLKMYQRDFAAYLQYAGSFDAALVPKTFANWRSHLLDNTEKSPNTMNRMISAIKSVMRAAAQHGYLAAPVATAFERVPLVRSDELLHRLRKNAYIRMGTDDIVAVLDTIDSTTLVGKRDAALVATLASGALRVSELTRLRVDQLRRKGPGFVIDIRGKNDVEYREAPLSREAMNLIEVWLRARLIESPYVFTAFDGRGDRATARPLSAVAVWKIVRRYSQQAGLVDVKPHDFRRFVGTQLARDDIRKAQKALGHRRIETTARYYVLDELEPGLTDNLY